MWFGAEGRLLGEAFLGEDFLTQLINQHPKVLLTLLNLRINGRDRRETIIVVAVVHPQLVVARQQLVDVVQGRRCLEDLVVNHSDSLLKLGCLRLIIRAHEELGELDNLLVFFDVEGESTREAFVGDGVGSGVAPGLGGLPLLSSHLL